MPNAARQRAFALETAQKLRAAGYESLWAGGCVRDKLLGITPKDYDVATNATPEQIRDLFGRRRTILIGAAFGVVTVLGPRDAGQIEVATFRTDAAYSDGRHPDSVRFTTAEIDAQRRDFTINGLFYDPIAEQVVDHVGGRDDLKAGIIRAIGNPKQRFAEDKLRLLRAVRFAATFDFQIEPATFAAIREMAPEINVVSAERIGMEFRRMLLDRNRSVALQLLRDTGLLHVVLPEFQALYGDPRESCEYEVLSMLKRLGEPSLPLVFATLLRFTQTADATTIGRRLRFTNKEIERANWLLANPHAIVDAPKTPWPKLQRLLTHEGIDDLLALAQSTSEEPLRSVAYCRERLAWPPEKLNPQPLLDGGDLIRHGLQPGPSFSSLLEQIRDAQLNGEIHSREEALLLVDRLRAHPETLR